MFRHRPIISRLHGVLVVASLCVGAPMALAQAPVAPGLAPAPTPAAKPAATRHKASSEFDHLTALALPPTDAAPQVIQVAATQQVTVVGKAHFTDAPLPDDDTESPKDQTDPTAPTLQPSFFHRAQHQVGDALANGAADNQQRRGRAQAAAGVSLAVPLNMN